MTDPTMSDAAFRSMCDRLRRRVERERGDRRGALGCIGPVQIVNAASTVRLGRTVSLAAPVEYEAGTDNPEPCTHDLAMPAAREARTGLAFALDEISLRIHGNADSHIDALSHVIFDGRLYGDTDARALTAPGTAGLSIEAAGQGIAGRGILLDVPRVRGTDWLEPGDHVTAADLAAAQESERVQVEDGDLVFVRVGHRRRRSEMGAWDAAESRAGLHPEALELLARQRIAVLGSDGNNDTAPSIVDGVDFPIHVLAIQVLGLYLLDYLQFEDLVPVCEAAQRWSFLCVIAPLRLPDATGSPINPIALL